MTGLSLSLSKVAATTAATLLFVAESTAQVAPTRCVELLQKLDRLFNAGDADGYLGQFAAEQPVLHDVHARQIRARLEQARRYGKKISRRSQIADKPELIGEHTVLVVRYETRLEDVDKPLHESGLLVLRERKGTADPVIAVELPAKIDCKGGGSFTCRACNYELGPAAGWLCVPMAPTRTSVVEGAVFLLLGTDLGLELSVEFGESAQTATVVVDRLVQRLRDRVPGASTPMTEPWSPPSLEGRCPDGFSAARAVVDLPDGQRTVFFAGVLGSLRHLLLLRGSSSAFRRHRDAIDELLASYELLSTDQSVAHRAAEALKRHVGSELLPSGEFVSTVYHVRCAAPVGWKPRLRCGGCAFKVTWNCPEQNGRMWLTGLLPPAGAAHWTDPLANAWLDDFVARLDRDRPEVEIRIEEDSDWTKPDGTGDRVRELKLTGEPNTVRWMRLLLRDQLLVVADGLLKGNQDEAAIRAALHSVGR